MVRVEVNKMEFISRLKVYRLKTGMKVSDIATAVGISERKLYEIESGKQSCPADIGYKLAELYGAEVAELFEPTRLKPIPLEGV
jgi:DNA-binding XRE family transcriptional regulator